MIFAARFAECLSEKEIDALETITRKLRDANAAGHPGGKALATRRS